MGIFGDIFREVVSEIGNAVVESISQEFEKNSYDEERVEELKVSMDFYPLNELEKAKKSADNDVREAATRVLDFRALIIDDIKENGVNGDFAQALDAYEVDDFVEIYMKTMQNVEDLYGKDAPIVVSVLKYLMPMKGAVSRYQEVIEGYYEDTDYLELLRITKQIMETADTVLLEEAYREKRNREEIVRVVMSDEIKELEDEEFMDITNLARCDSMVKHADGTAHYTYFGYDRDNVFKRCENEMRTNRKHLLRTFVVEYCDEELEKYSSYSEEQLYKIVRWKNGEACEYDNGYDYFDKFVALYFIETKFKKES